LDNFTIFKDTFTWINRAKLIFGRVLGEHKKTLRTVAIIAVVIFLVSLPFIFRTKVYPITVVEGNSMVPSLYSGDVVVFSEVESKLIPNGTIIVFVQSNLNLNGFDYLLKPIVIHRVIGTVIQQDGTIYYRTKGDNNQQPDPILVRESNVLGKPILIIPRIGLIFLFFTSPQGLVVLVALITLYYLGKFDAAIKKDGENEKFLASLSKFVLNRTISYELFGYLSVASKFGKDFQPSEEKTVSSSFLKWLKRKNIEGDYDFSETVCPNCNMKALLLTGKKTGDKVILCSFCFAKEQIRTGLSVESKSDASESREGRRDAHEL
jgi:signal peptidase